MRTFANWMMSPEGPTSMQILKMNDYRPCFSGHETFPLRYSWLQKAYHAVAEANSPKDAVQIFRNPESIARFGIGRNMVGAIRFWATNAGIVEEIDEGLETTWLGDLLFGANGSDPYLEDDSSLWLIHWHLASRARLTSIYWLFNEFRAGSFIRHDIVTALLNLSEECGWSRVAATTVDRDLQCLLRTYLGGRGSSEAGDSVLAELSLIRPLDKQRSTLSRGRKPTLTDDVFLYCLADFWNNSTPDQATMSFETLAYAAGSPGRVFLLNEADIIDRLERLNLTSQETLSWSETAGLRQVIQVRKVPLELRRKTLADALLGKLRNVAS
jgi:Protein of unknown function (DUF4007)